MRLSDLLSEIADSIRAHHASGHFDHDEARARLMADGRTADQADAILVRPVPDALLLRLTTHQPGMVRPPCAVCDTARDQARADREPSC